MAGYRINERNSGGITLEGDPKKRRTKADKNLTLDESDLAVNILGKVLSVMEYDREMSEGKGHLNPDAKFIDGGRFCLMMSGSDISKLYSVLDKLRK